VITIAIAIAICDCDCDCDCDLRLRLWLCEGGLYNGLFEILLWWLRGCPVPGDNNNKFRKHHEEYKIYSR